MTGRKFSDWAREQETRETPAQAELRRRFGEAFRRTPGAMREEDPPDPLCIDGREYHRRQQARRGRRR